MNDTFTFTSNAVGRELRENLAVNLTRHGITFELSESVFVVGKNTFPVLVLTKTGKRPGEGQIAAALKQY